LIFRDHLCNAGIHHRRHRQPILVIDEPVQKRAKLRLDRTVLRANHRSADHLRLKSDLINGAKETDRIVQIGAKKQNIRVDRLQVANKWSKIRRRQRISDVRYDLEAMFIRMHLGAWYRTVGK